MLKSAIKSLFAVAQQHFDLRNHCDVCNHTGVLIRRRTGSGRLPSKYQSPKVSEGTLMECFATAMPVNQSAQGALGS
jgi:hypothetical protein